MLQLIVVSAEQIAGQGEGDWGGGKDSQLKNLAGPQPSVSKYLALEIYLLIEISSETSEAFNSLYQTDIQEPLTLPSGWPYN